MKMTTKKKTIYGIIILFALVLVFSLVSMSNTNDKFDFCVFGSLGNPLCVKTASSGFTAAITAGGQGVNGYGTTFYPGQTIEVSTEVDYTRDFVPPLYVAQVAIKNLDNSQTLEVWDISDEVRAQPKVAQCTKAATCQPLLQPAYSPCPSKDICTTLKTVFGTPIIRTIAAPQLPGTYQVSYFIRDSKTGDNLFERSDQTVTVIAKPAACKVGSTTCTGWTTDSSQSTQTATIQKRTCSTYDDQCVKSDLPEFRTNCISGYLITGQSGISSTGVKTCVVVQPDTVYTKPDSATNTTPSTTVTTQPTNTTPPTVACTVTNTCTDAPKTNAFTQFFTDFWTTIKDWFYSVFG